MSALPKGDNDEVLSLTKGELEGAVKRRHFMNDRLLASREVAFSYLTVRKATFDRSRESSDPMRDS